MLDMILGVIPRDMDVDFIAIFLKEKMGFQVRVSKGRSFVFLAEKESTIIDFFDGIGDGSISINKINITESNREEFRGIDFDEDIILKMGMKIGSNASRVMTEILKYFGGYIKTDSNRVFTEVKRDSGLLDLTYPEQMITIEIEGREVYKGKAKDIKLKIPNLDCSYINNYNQRVNEINRFDLTIDNKGIPALVNNVEYF